MTAEPLSYVKVQVGKPQDVHTRGGGRPQPQDIVTLPVRPHPRRGVHTSKGSRGPRRCRPYEPIASNALLKPARERALTTHRDPVDPPRAPQLRGLN